MELYIAGGCSEHGRNCFLVRGDHISFLVDAGLMKENPDIPYPKLSDEQIAGAGYLFLTHSHSDHAGAVPWLFRHGFHGVVIASRPTFASIPEIMGERKVLEDLASPLEECNLKDGLSLTWGRSGHCMGSVWFRFRAEGRTLIFTGDYEEKSLAYCCNRIRGEVADLAVIDCAYGLEAQNASVNRKGAREAVMRWGRKEVPLLFPVPSNGRGLDVIRLLADADIPVICPDETEIRCRKTEENRFWLKAVFFHSVTGMKREDSMDLQDFLKEWEGGAAAFPKKIQNAAVLVNDSQLSRLESRKAADAVIAAGGRVILTGKQDPSSYARKLLDEGKAEFDRLSVHQNKEEMEDLDRLNHFRCVVPYHSRQVLHFDDERMLVLKAGDSVNF